MIRFYLHDESATTQLGELLFCWLSTVSSESASGISVFLRGPLGAGKSALVRAVLRAAGVSGNIPSPTYSLVEHYPVSKALQFYHVDAYRLAGSDELDYLGAEDWSGPGVVLMVEWPDQVLNALPAVQLEITLDYNLPAQIAAPGVESDCIVKRSESNAEGAVGKGSTASGPDETGFELSKSAAQLGADVSGRVVTLDCADIVSRASLSALLKKSAFLCEETCDLDTAQSSSSVI